MPFVIDASIILARLLPDDHSSEAVAVLDRIVAGDTPLAPAGWPGEVANGLLNAERRRRISAETTNDLLADVAALPVNVDAIAIGERLGDVVALAREQGLTVYDAAYLELAIRERALVATLDDDLRAAARRANVGLVES